MENSSESKENESKENQNDAEENLPMKNGELSQQSKESEKSGDRKPLFEFTDTHQTTDKPSQESAKESAKDEEMKDEEAAE